MRPRRKHLFVLGCITVALFIPGGAVWFAAPYYADDPMNELAKQTPVRTWYDRNGKILWHERTFDAQWRFPVPLSKISPNVIRVILSAEDASFYEHSGVDYSAVCRAAWQNVAFVRRVSGASTISMQLAGMTLPGKHGFKRKFIQAVKARKLEMRHSKEEILTEYLNRVPFGGKIYGIEAAAQYYLGMSAEKLNLAEAALLCGLPQKPNKLRPDRNLSGAKERQRIVLKLLTRHGEITPDEAKRILTEEPLRFRDFRYRAAFELAASPGELFHALSAANEQTETTLDRELHFQILSFLRAQKEQLCDVQDGAALLLDNRSGKVLCYIGTLNFSCKSGGEVDVIRSIRGAGSSLKPFIYAEAINGGWLVEATKIPDAPVRYGDYSPGNYDGRFHGLVSAGYALSNSLNTPAVRLVALLGESRVREAFNRSGLSRFRKNERIAAGLSLALGSDGYSLWDITRAYSMLANGGKLFSFSLNRNEAPVIPENVVFPKEVCLMVCSMLRERPLGYSGLDVAWKTGTSNNNCDAWCFAFTPDYTLGVWFGNKDGKRSPDLIGAKAALPVASEIFELLYKNKPFPQWPDEFRLLELRELCAESGLTPGAFCKRKIRQTAIPRLSLASCRMCSPHQKNTLKILSPAPKSYRTAPGKSSVVLNLRTDRREVVWFLNGRRIDGNPNEYEFAANARYILRAVHEPSGHDAPPVVAEVVFSVTGT